MQTATRLDLIREVRALLADAYAAAGHPVAVFDDDRIGVALDRYAAKPVSAAPGPAPAIERRLANETASSGDTALAGADGRKAEQLLESSKKKGAAVLADVTRRALNRWLGHGPNVLANADRLYNDAERQEIADSIAATNITANLLGRSRIRLRLAKHSEPGAAFKFSDPTDFSAFDDATDPLEPFPPEQALDFFRGKVPMPGVQASKLTAQVNRQAFTLAVNTDEVVLGRVKTAIQNVIETGKEVRATPQRIADILQSAGITETVGGKQVGGAYSEMVFRTNMTSAYNEGSQQELAEVQEDFPVWRYAGIDDGRQRLSHAVHNDKYFPSSVEFTEVRDSVKGEFDGFQCRCTMIPIFREEWKVLQAAGAHVEQFAEKFCGGKGGKPGPCPEGGATDLPKSQSKAKSLVAQDIPRDKAAIAKATHKPSTKAKQDHAKANQGVVADGVGGQVVDDNAPTDVTVPRKRGGVHGVEVKTMLDNGNDRVKMNKAAYDRKAKWSADTGNPLHTSVTDDRDIFDGGKNAYQYSGNKLYYKRGGGSFTIDGMHPVESHAEMKRLMDLPDNQLPLKAQPLPAWTARVKQASGWKQKGIPVSAAARAAQENAQ